MSCARIGDVPVDRQRLKQRANVIPEEWLRERLDTEDVDEVARRDLRRAGIEAFDVERLLTGRGFALWRRRWTAFVDDLKPGDELWRYESSSDRTAGFAGTAGYAILREGKPIHTLTSWRS